MSEWALRSETLAWLLEPSNPSARYLTQISILRQSKENPEVRASRAAIPQIGPARDILLAQYPQGYWMHPGIGYSPRYRATIWQILLLAQLGMPRCEQLDRAVAYLWEANQRDDGALRASKDPDDTPIGLNASLLWALETLGYGDAPQARNTWSWLVREVGTKGMETTPLWEAVKVLWAANAVLPQCRDDGVAPMSHGVAEALLNAPPSRAKNDPRWFRLTFPLTEAADLLQWMEVLGAAGYGDDPRLTVAKSWLAQKQGPNDTWPLERVPGKLWADFGMVGEPNKWVTIRALAVGR